MRELRPTRRASARPIYSPPDDPETHMPKSPPMRSIARNVVLGMRVGPVGEPEYKYVTPGPMGTSDARSRFPRAAPMARSFNVSPLTSPAPDSPRLNSER